MSSADPIRLPAGVSRTEPRPGCPAIEVALPGVAATVFLQGAHLTRWCVDDAEVIFTSRNAEYRPGKAIRGGIPVCLPWFGGGPDGTRTPAHGYARISAWSLQTALRGSGPDGPSVLLGFGFDARRATHSATPMSR